MFNAASKPHRFATAFLRRCYAAKRQIREVHAVSVFLRRDQIDNRISQNGYPGCQTRSRFSTELKQSFNVENHPPVIREEDNIKLYKQFYSVEDGYAHMTLRQRKAYAETVVCKLPSYGDEVTKGEIDEYLAKVWALTPIPEIIEAFKRVSYFASENGECIADTKYDRMVKYLVANLGRFTDSEIQDVMKALALWPPFHTRKDTNFRTLFQALDVECVRRARQWTIDQLLLFADHIYLIRMAKYSSFCSWVITRLGTRVSRLSPSNMVQYMFYANSTRAKCSVMCNLELRLEQCIDELDMKELAIVSLGFFKTETPIRSSDLLVKIIHRTIAEMETIDSISLAAQLKIIGYSYRVLLDNKLVPEFLMSILPQIPRITLLTLVHIVTVNIKLRIFQPELLTAIAKRFSEEIRNARLKDIERLTLGLSVFNFTPQFQPNIYETIVTEIRRPERQDELKLYGKLLGRILQFLSVVKVYPKDLMATVLAPEYLKRVYGDSAYRINAEILSVDLNIGIEVPDYTGPRLNDEARQIIAKSFVNKLPDRTSTKLTNRQTLLVEVLDTCEDIFGSDKMAHPDWLLPQYRDVDVVICLDKNNLPVIVKHILSEMPIGNVKRPENYLEGYKWLALVIATKNCYRNGTRNLLGKDITKLRQLEKIGYTPVLLPWYDWFADGQNKVDYLKKKIYQS